MKRLVILILVWALLVITGTLVSANGKTLSAESQITIINQFALTNSRQTVSN